MLSIRGEGLSVEASETVVHIGGMRALVTGATPGQIDVQVPNGAVHGPVTVTRGDGFSAQSSLPFLPTFSGGGNLTGTSFAAMYTNQVGSQPYAMTSADLDGDSKPDLIVVNHLGGNGSGASPGLTILRNTSEPGLLSFATPVGFSAIATGLTPTAADMDGDGLLDIVVANALQGSFSVYRNVSTPGKVALQPAVTIQAGVGPYGLVVGDVDGDGKLDVVLNDAAKESPGILVFRNINTPGNVSAGSFLPVALVPGLTDTRYPAFGDLDGDGRGELIVANSAHDSISIFPNRSAPGTVAWGSRIDLPSGHDVIGFVLGDVDGDGKLDIAVNSLGNDRVGGMLSIWRNQFSGGDLRGESLLPRQDYLLGGNVGVPAAGDLNGDGRLDFALPIPQNEWIAVLQNTLKPTGLDSSSFGLRVNLGVPSRVKYLYFPLIADFDGDGRPDVALSNDQNVGYVSIFRSQASVSSGIRIVAQPVSQVGSLGARISLEVRVVGDGPFTYQWFHDGQLLSDETTAILSIPKLTAGNLGRYYVKVGAGSLTVDSDEVTLSAASIQMYAGLTLEGVPGTRFQVEFAEALRDGPGVWASLTNFTLPSSPYLFIDVDSPGKPARYYRAHPLVAP